MADHPFPQVKYGQSSGAWSPATRAPVYQQVERARSDADFARLFAADILFGKKETGGAYYTYVPREETYIDANGFERTRTVNVLKKQKVDRGYLYNNNTLNASKSWVAQAFASPVVKDETGGWFLADTLVDQKAGQGGYGFLKGAPLQNANLARLLNEGHYAFRAKGVNGSEVYVPYADGFMPQKGGRARREAGNAKAESQAGTGRDRVLPGNARPGSIISGDTDDRNAMSGSPAQGKTLLGGASNANAGRTLLGGGT